MNHSGHQIHLAIRAVWASSLPGRLLGRGSEGDRDVLLLHVSALKKRDVELPSDIQGMLWIEMATGDEWKLSLIHDVQAAGLQIDLNNL